MASRSVALLHSMLLLDISADLFKLLFTGTFSSLDRKTCEATAKKYGATLVTPAKISEVDMVVLGAKAGYDFA